MPSPNFVARLGPSRETLVVTFRDGTAPASLAALNPASTTAASVAGASGTFTLTYNGQTTAAIPIASAAAAVRAALEALAGVGAGNVTVAGLAPYLITPAGALAGTTPTITVNTGGLSNTFAAVPDASTAPGSGAAQTVYNNSGLVGFEPPGSWTLVLSNWSGASPWRYVSAAPGVLTPCLATWPFTVAAGTYDVFSTWPDSTAFASNACYRIYDGTTLRSVVRVDQRVRPPIYEGVAWPRQVLDRVYCASGSLRVVLSNDGADNPVVADAVQVVPVGALATLAMVDDDNDVLVPNGLLATVGGWSRAYGGSGHYRGYRHDSVDPAGTATFRLDWLAAGTYQVQATWPVSTWYVNPAHYAIYDGTTLLTTLDLNTSVAPAGGDVAGSVTFQVLGTYTINSGSLKVVVSGALGAYEGGFLGVDAILVKPTGGTPNIGIPTRPTIAVSGSVASSGGYLSMVVTPSGGSPGSPIVLSGVNIPGSSFVIYPLAAPLAADDAATVTAPNNWALTSAGGMPAATDQAVVTGLDTLLPAFVAGPKTMAVGWGTNNQSYNNAGFWYADLMKQASNWNTGAAVLDADGFPLSTPAGGIFCQLSWPLADYISDRGIPNIGPGDYTIMWDGPGNCWLSGSDVVMSEDSSAAVTGGATDNQRVFSIAPMPYRAAPYLSAWADGECPRIRVWPPGVPTDGSLLFHPNLIAQLEGCSNLRVSGPIATNPSNLVDYAEFPSPTRRTFSWNDHLVQVPIAGLSGTLTSDQQAVASSWFPGGNAKYAVTTAAPHGMQPGHLAMLNVPYGNLKLQLQGPSGVFDYILAGSLGMVIPYDATTLIVGSGPEPIVGTAYTGGGYVFKNQDAGPPEHVAALANVLRPLGLKTLHLTVPFQLSDAGCAALFAMLAATLHPDLNLLVEHCNEPWNNGVPFVYGYQWFQMLAVHRGHGLTQRRQHVQRSAEVWAIADAAWATAGRPAGQVIRAINTITPLAAAGFIADIMAYADSPTDPAAGGAPIRVDIILIASYFGAGYYDKGATLYNMNKDQCMDVVEMFMPGQAAGYGAGRAELVAAGHPEVRIGGYEWGPNQEAIGGGEAAMIAQSQMCNNHPRMRGVILAMIQESQDGGCSYMAKAGHVSDLSGDLFPHGSATYGAYNAWNMVPGKGDGTDGEADNRPHLDAVVVRNTVGVTSLSRAAGTVTVVLASGFTNPLPATPLSVGQVVLFQGGSGGAIVGPGAVTAITSPTQLTTIGPFGADGTSTGGTATTGVGPKYEAMCAPVGDAVRYWSSLESGYVPPPSMAVTPTTVTVGVPTAMTAAGTNTAWDEATTFDAGAGGTVSGVTVDAEAQTATFTLTASHAGTVTIHDSADDAVDAVTATGAEGDAPPAVAVTGLAVRGTFATITAEVVAGTGACVVALRYGATSSYGKTRPPDGGRRADVTPADGATAVAFLVAGLDRQATYHYSVAATDPVSGLSDATADATFTTVADHATGGRRRGRG